MQNRELLEDMVLQEGSEDLRMIAGLIISEIWPGGAPTKASWFFKRELHLCADFPKRDHENTQWALDFESYVDDLAARRAIKEP